MPLEVKSGSVTKMKSLNQFCVEKKSELGIVASGNAYSFKEYSFQAFDGAQNKYQGYKLLQIPIYQIEFLREILLAIMNP